MTGYNNIMARKMGGEMDLRVNFNKAKSATYHVQLQYLAQNHAQKHFHSVEIYKGFYKPLLSSA